MKSKFDLWLEKVNKERKEYWEDNFTHKEYEPLRVDKGRKYIRLWDGTSCWGFVSMWEGINKGSVVKQGDLLKPQGWQGPAKHSRGNIFDETASWNYYGPNYLI